MTPRELSDVPGWLSPVDQQAIAWILDFQNANCPAGDLVELGAYKGRSAIHIANFQKAGETFFVCDLFDDAATSSEINPAVGKFYKAANLTQREFERNFLAFHPALPKIVRGPSSSIVDHVAPGSVRFMHIDASHMYEHVRRDALSARTLLSEDGVVVFDDYREEHTPGTAAAVWEAVLMLDLRPVFVTPGKLYATWGNPNPLRKHIRRLTARPGSGLKASRNLVVGDNRFFRLHETKSKGQRSFWQRLRQAVRAFRD